MEVEMETEGRSETGQYDLFLLAALILSAPVSLLTVAVSSPAGETLRGEGED